MMSKYIKMQIGEVVDRYSILLLKSERTDLNVVDEIEHYKSCVDSYEDSEFWVEKLKQINSRIWDLESDIRKGKEKLLGLKEVGRRALLIRNINNERVACKNEITELYKEGYAETKKDHASE